MSYSIKQLAQLSGVSVRTLHYYDEIGLLRPARSNSNQYRYYEENDLMKLQQILFFRELEFPLADIEKIITAPSFELRTVLADQRRLIELKKNRLNKLIKTIDRTIKKINREICMTDNELYGNFSKAEMKEYTAEARQRWGQTDAFKQSQERVKKMGKAGLKRVLAESGKLTLAMAECMKSGAGPTDSRMQQLVARHYNGLREFYEPTPEIYRGLAEMYVADERFQANYEKIAPGLAAYLSAAMIYYAADQKKKLTKRN